MGIPHSQIDDLVILTQDKLIKRGAFVDMQTDLTDHVAVRELWHAHTKEFDGGLDWTFDVMMDHNHSARAVGLYETDGSSLTDNMKEGKVGPRHVNAHYIYDQREAAFQRGGLAIVNYVRKKYVGMMVSFFEKLEEFLWGKPTDSSDLKTPFGINYWVTKSATEGFNGSNPAGFTDGRAGVSTGTYPRFANWTAQYADITVTDLIRKMRRAMRRTNFRSPVSHATPDFGTMRNGIYTNDTVVGLMEELLETKSMNVAGGGNNDLATMDGRTVFKSVPIQYAPYLNDDTTDPIYMLDWKHIVVGVLAGWQNELSAPYMVTDKHLVRRVDLDASLNMVSTDIRRHAVISK